MMLFLGIEPTQSLNAVVFTTNNNNSKDECSYYNNKVRGIYAFRKKKQGGFCWMEMVQFSFFCGLYLGDGVIRAT